MTVVQRARTAEEIDVTSTVRRHDMRTLRTAENFRETTAVTTNFGFEGDEDLLPVVVGQDSRLLVGIHPSVFFSPYVSCYAAWVTCGEARSSTSLPTFRYFAVHIEGRAACRSPRELPGSAEP